VILNNIIEIFSDHLNEKNFSKNTKESYIRDVRQFTVFIEESFSVNDVRQCNSTNIISYLLHLQKKNIAVSTVARKLASVKALYTYLHNSKHISDNPTITIKSPKTEKKLPEVLSIEEVERLMEQPDSTHIGIRDKAIFEILYASGIKVSQLINLDITDINLDMGYLKCKMNTNETRLIPIGTHAIKALSKYMQDGRGFLTSTDEEALFVNYYGNRLSRQGLWKMIKRYSESAEIQKKITPYTLRHSFATHLIQNGADLKSVQEMMGHSDVSVTQKYMDLNKKRIQEVYKKTHPRA